MPAPLQPILGPWRRADYGGAMPGARWVPPVAALHGVDTRTLPQMARTDAEGAGSSLFYLPADATLPRGCRWLTDDARKVWLGEMPDADGDTADELLTSALTDHSDPAGQAAPKTLMPDSHGVVSIVAQGRTIYREAYTPQHRAAAKVEALVRNDYRAIAEREGDAADSRSGFLEGVQIKLRMTRDEAMARLIPSDLPQRAPRTPGTSKAESWDGPNSGTLPSGWVEYGNGAALSISSNRLTSGANYQTAAWNTAFGYADMFVQIEHPVVYTLCAGTPMRFNPASGTASAHGGSFYWQISRTTPSPYVLGIKTISGVDSEIGNSSAQVLAVGQTLKSLINGALFEVYQSNNIRVSTTDPSISGFLYAGVQSHAGVTSDNWLAQDIPPTIIDLRSTFRGSFRGVNRGAA